MELPACPAEVIAASGQRLRVVLTTPAIFKDGAVPATIRGARVVAACVGRPEVISGWDFSKSNGGAPKATRRMAPAGSVYWVELDAGQNRNAWIGDAWMKSVSDDAQDQRDGFGVAVVGVA